MGFPGMIQFDWGWDKGYAEGHADGLAESERVIVELRAQLVVLKRRLTDSAR